MVKKVDDSEAIHEHVGVDLWRAALAWRTRLHGEMVRRGFGYYGDARGAVLQHLDTTGVSQTELTRRMGLSKQAVQQLLDGLEADDVVQRVADPRDARVKRVVYTERGRAGVREAGRVKREIEAEYARRLGGVGLRQLAEMLRLLAD